MDSSSSPSSSRTSLVYGRRVDKVHVRIQACGGVDELNSALGLCRAHTSCPLENESIRCRQRELNALMSEMGTADSDQDRFLKESEHALSQKCLDQLVRDIEELEAKLPRQEGWLTPGDNPLQAFYDQARTICRRVERQLLLFYQSGLLVRPLLLDYLNRLSKFLWMLERRHTPGHSPDSRD